MELDGERERNGGHQAPRNSPFARASAIRIARLLMGNGRWGPEDLAREIECSVRTIFRDIEILTVSGMPITYAKELKAYRVREGFRFSGLDPQKVPTCDPANAAIHDLLVTARQVLKEADGFLGSLRQLCEQLKRSPRG